MTFPEFQASRVWSDDLGPIYDGQFTDATNKPCGWVYATHYCIETVQPHWPDAAIKAGAYYLMLGNLEWITDDLESLERRLYDYALSENGSGHTNAVTTLMRSRGYDSMGTGGGCETWMREIGDGTMVWICTQDQGLHADPAAHEWLLGRYSVDELGGWVGCDDALTLADALALASRIPSPLADDMAGVMLTRKQIEEG